MWHERSQPCRLGPREALFRHQSQQRGDLGRLKAAVCSVPRPGPVSAAVQPRSPEPEVEPGS